MVILHVHLILGLNLLPRHIIIRKGCCLTFTKIPHRLTDMYDIYGIKITGSLKFLY